MRYVLERRVQEITWRPTIGDPSMMGWLTVLAYLAVSWLCLQAFQVEKRGPSRPLRQAIPAALRVLKKHWPRPPLPLKRALLWLLLSVLMLGLAINKQLDFQTLLTDIGRVTAKRGGWYGHREQVQYTFIAAILAVAVVSILWLWWITRKQLRDFRLPLLGLAFIFAFVVVRASSFHIMDEFIALELLGLRVNWILELGGIAIILAGAMRRLLRRDLSGADYAEGVPPNRPPSSRSGG